MAIEGGVLADSTERLTPAECRRCGWRTGHVSKEYANGKRNADCNFRLWMKSVDNRPMQRNRDSRAATNTRRLLAA
jgi:ribosomal protein L37E